MSFELTSFGPDVRCGGNASLEESKDDGPRVFRRIGGRKPITGKRRGGYSANQQHTFSPAAEGSDTFFPCMASIGKLLMDRWRAL